MSTISYSLLSNEQQLSYSGDKVRADAYYGNSDGIHTVSFTFGNFTGRVYIEGTLSSNPTESDWFPIEFEPITFYKEYDAFSGTEGFTFKVNLLYVRARVDRDYLGANEYNETAHGSITKSLVNV